MRRAVGAPWFAAAVLGLVGAGLVVAGGFADGYLRACLVNVGTAVALIGVVFFIEQRVLDAVRGPRNLDEAQQALTSVIASARERGGGRTAGAVGRDRRAACLQHLARQLVAAGLRQQPCDKAPDAILMEDCAGLRLRWEITWDGEGLVHHVLVDGAELKTRGRRAVRDGEASSDGQRTLADLEDDVFVILRRVLTRLDTTR